MNTKINKVENIIPDHSKYIITQEFNKLASKYFAPRLKQDDLVNKTGFDDKLISFNKRIDSNKTKHIEVQKKLNILITKDNSFFLGRIYFASNDGSQNAFVYQPAVDVLELKKEKVTDYVFN